MLVHGLEIQEKLFKIRVNTDHGELMLTLPTKDVSHCFKKTLRRTHLRQNNKKRKMNYL